MICRSLVSQPAQRPRSIAALRSLSSFADSQRSIAANTSDDDAVKSKNMDTAVAGARRPLGRAASYAPSTSSTGQDAADSPIAELPKKKRNLVGKIDAWWNTVTRSFSPSPTPDGRGSDPVFTAASPMSPPPALLDMSSLTSDSLVPVVSLPQEGRLGMSSKPPSSGSAVPLRHVRSSNALATTSSQSHYVSPPTGALAPAARSVTSVEPMPPAPARMHSGGSEGSSGSGSAARSDARRRNPQLSLRLDPRFKPAGSVHRLTDKREPHNSRDSTSRSQSSASGGVNDGSPPVFKEPRPPIASRQPSAHEHTPNLMPGAGPIWDQTPGLVPLSQGQSMRLSRTASKLSKSRTASSASLRPGNLPTPVEPTSVRDQVKQRMTTAKQACDRDLLRIIGGISSYVENELEAERAVASHESRQEEETDVELTHDESDAPRDRDDGHNHHVIRPVPLRQPLLRRDTDSSMSGNNSESGSRVQSPGNSHPRWLGVTGRGRRSGTSSPRRILSQRKSSVHMPVKPAELAMRLEQSLAAGPRASVTPVSQSSSRSTSRSRSPMPGHGTSGHGHRTHSGVWSARGHGQQDEERELFLNSLQALVATAQELLDSSPTDLVNLPETCGQIIQKVQIIGKRWDNHPNWPLRGWYVQLLLAASQPSRVAEFWTAERDFWKLEAEEQQEDEDEPIMFIAKPGYEDLPVDATTVVRSRAPSIANSRRTSFLPKTEATDTDGRDLGVRVIEDPDIPIKRTALVTDGAPVAAALQQSEAEVLREAVNEVRNATIVMEIALDGESFQYISPVWKEVVG